MMPLPQNASSTPTIEVSQVFMHGTAKRDACPGRAPNGARAGRRVRARRPSVCIGRMRELPERVHVFMRYNGRRPGRHPVPRWSCNWLSELRSRVPRVAFVRCELLISSLVHAALPV